MQPELSTSLYICLKNGSCSRHLPPAESELLAVVHPGAHQNHHRHLLQALTEQWTQPAADTQAAAAAAAAVAAAAAAAAAVAAAAVDRMADLQINTRTLLSGLPELNS